MSDKSRLEAPNNINVLYFPMCNPKQGFGG